MSSSSVAPSGDVSALARRVALVAGAAGIAGSVWMLSQYLMPPSFGACPLDGGCQSVRACRWAVNNFFLPPLGIISFALWAILSTSSNAFARKARVLFGAIIGASGIGLVFVQALVCRAFCPFCLVVDASAITLGLAAFMSREAPREPMAWLRMLPLLAFLLSASASWGWAHHRMTEPIRPALVEVLPARVEALQTPGKVTIVDMFNFACPHCRAQRPRLVEALRRNAELVTIRYVYPVPSDASRAGICAEAQQRTEAVVDDLFATQAFDRPSLLSMASRLGLDVAAFRTCLDSPATGARLDADRALALDARVASLPSIFIGHERYEGVVPPPDVISASVRREAARRH